MAATFKYWLAESTGRVAPARRFDCVMWVMLAVWRAFQEGMWAGNMELVAASHTLGVNLTSEGQSTVCLARTVSARG